MVKSLKNVKPRVMRTALTYIGILCGAAFCESNAWAETILIESDTFLYLDFSQKDGGELNVSLVDDLFQGIPEKKVKIQITQIETGLTVLSSSNLTDGHGHIAVKIRLPEGDYQADASYEGEKGYLQTRESFDIHIEKCGVGAKFDMENRLWHLGHDFNFYVTRTDVACAQSSVVWVVNAGGEKSFHEMKSGVWSMPVTIPGSVAQKTGKIDITVENNNDTLVLPEKIEETVYVYDEFLDNVGFVRNNGHLAIQAETLYRLREYGNFNLWIKYPYHDEIMDVEMSLAKAGKYYVNLEDDVSECMDVEVYIKNNNIMDSLEKRSVCITGMVKHPSIAYLLLFGVPVLGLGFMLAYMQLSRRRRLRNMLPQLRSNQTVMVDSDAWLELLPLHIKKEQIKRMDMEIPTKKVDEHSVCEIICADEKSHSQINPEEVTISYMGNDGNEVVTQIYDWPYKVAMRMMYTISHKHYVTWSGKIKQVGRHVIYLKSRRDFVIACFEAVCNRLIGKTLPWGRETPSELYWHVVRRHMIRDRKALEKFCQNVSEAVFDIYEITDEQMEAIRAYAEKD